MKKTPVLLVLIFLPEVRKEKESYFSNGKIFQNFEGHNHWHTIIGTVGTGNILSYWQFFDRQLMLPGACPDQGTPDIDSTAQAVGQCDVQIVKTIF